MNFNEHLRLKDQHAYLGASKYHWVNYDDEKLINTYLRFQATQRGTELHALACMLINQGVKLQKSCQTLNMYVNDAIGFKMHPEQILRIVLELRMQYVLEKTFLEFMISSLAKQQPL